MKASIFTARLLRLGTLEHHLQNSDRYPVQSVLDDARRSGECVALRAFLLIEQVAFRFLTSDLKERSTECTAELEPSAETARRHRLVIDEAIQRFRRMTDVLPGGSNESSIRFKTKRLFDEFCQKLHKSLPFVDCSPIESIPVGDWDARHSIVASRIDALVSDLQPLITLLDQHLEEKGRLCEEINEYIEKVLKII